MKDEENYKKAGAIAKQVKDYARTIIKKDSSLLELAEKIEAKIIELKGNIAFPVNLSINEIAAHYTPSYDDELKAEGLLKVDLGVHINGCIADTAFSIDLENSEENKNLILAAESALNKAIETAKEGIETSQIGNEIQKAISKHNFCPIINLSGHELKENILHAGITIPNYDNKSQEKISKGVYAIEPFATSGQGKVIDGKMSGIYMLISKKPIRDISSRKILEFIEKNYSTMPFASRWLVKEFGKKSLISLSILEKAGILHQFPQLIEISRKNVSQAEDTIIVSNKTEVLTR